MLNAKKNPSYTAAEIHVGTAPWVIIMEIPQKSKNNLLYNLDIPIYF